MDKNTPPPKSPPSMTKHADGYWRVSWYAWGKRQRLSFGKKRSIAYDRYHQWAAEWNALPVNTGEEPRRTIAELYPEFREWQDGRSKNRKSVLEYDYAMAPILKKHGDLDPAEFTPELLRAVRRAFVKAEWSRRIINKRVNQIKAVWKWMVAEGYIGGETLVGLQSLTPLRHGEAAGPAPVRAVDEDRVERTKAVLTPTLRAMVDLQCLTGMRPGEVCAMNWPEIKIEDDVWLFCPAEHKTAHHGRDRVIPIGPSAQAIILRAFGDGPREGVVFRVGRHTDELLAQVREARDAGEEPEYLRYPFYKKMFQEAQERRLRDESGWTANGYYQAIRAACDRAQVDRWTPNQLRHLYATKMRKAVGLDRASSMLGHSKVETTQIYAEVRLQEIIETATRHG